MKTLAIMTLRIVIKIMTLIMTFGITTLSITILSTMALRMMKFSRTTITLTMKM